MTIEQMILLGVVFYLVILHWEAFKYYKDLRKRLDHISMQSGLYAHALENQIKHGRKQLPLRSPSGE